MSNLSRKDVTPIVSKINIEVHRTSSQWRQVWLTFLPVLMLWWKRLSIAYLFGLLAVVAAVLTPWPLKYIIDNVLSNQPLPAFFGSVQQQFEATTLVVILALIAAALALIGAICSAAEKNMNARIREQMTLKVRIATLEHIETLSLVNNTSHRSGELVLRLIDDVRHIVRLFTKTMPGVARHLFSTLAILAAMVWLEPVMGLIGLVIVGFMALLVRIFAGKLHGASKSKRKNEGKVAAFAQEVFRGLPGIQAMGMEDKVESRFQHANEKSLQAGVYETRVAVSMERIMQIANGLAVAIVIGAGGWMVLAGKLSLGGLTICATYIVQLLKPVEKINELASSIARGIIRGEHLIQLLLREAEVKERENPLPLSVTPATGRIELREVSFSYPDQNQPDIQRTVFDHISLQIEPGSFTILEGQSGSGKSTLLNLLLRLYDPQQGSLLLDGIPYKQLRIKSIRDQFAVMLQDAHFFAGSLRESLQPTDSEISDDEIWQALENVAMVDFVRQLTDKLDTPLGEGAGNLSGGQRARLSLARALLMKRPILLLDEPLANVDEKSQQVIIAELQRLKGSQTCIAVSHQPALRQCASRVVHLTDGRLVEALSGNLAEPEQNTGKHAATRKQNAATNVAADKSPLNEGCIITAINHAGNQRGWWPEKHDWKCTYTRTAAAGDAACTLLYESEVPDQHLCLLNISVEQPPANEKGIHLYDASIGWMFVTPFYNDPVLHTLPMVLERYTSNNVVRYRPSRRCTLKAHDSVSGKQVFVKVFADQRGEIIFRESAALWQALQNKKISFQVAEAIDWSPQQKAITLGCVAGQPVIKQLFSHQGHSLARRMGAACGTLPGSGIEPSLVFTRENQYKRTLRYATEFKQHVPELVADIDEYLERVQNLNRSIDSRSMFPIHGAPHAHQWLDDGENLGLIDFDRVCMGDPELDVATFVAEMDFEDPLQVPIQQLIDEFIAGYESTAGKLNIPLMQLYRSQKRFAKALKAARKVGANKFKKANRNFAASKQCLQEIEVSTITG